MVHLPTMLGEDLGDILGVNAVEVQAEPCQVLDRGPRRGSGRAARATP
jgi:hypothetical protein